ncbi:hypothetical protein LY90DRAFT_517049 [Neocallimastix californiae]|uniref:Uncharacterized protein n=1 Tax=Neocallimastix californiae TaxID=1754190 RepID=A0A1Y2ACB9_9FUNG|nr:hypothetical protein LY90DRAFT_517049 [Neocallimastix californiae]|eukprot:ORY20142.1 hypothetical protein LY90DRAFT_517049 [Neocallimastix californiae]
MDNDDNKEENNNNKDVKLNMNVIKEDNNDDDDDDKVSFVSFLPPNKNRNSSNNNNNSNSKDNKDTDKSDKSKKIHGIKINSKNGIFKRNDRYVYNNGKYYVKKSEKDNEYNKLLLENLSKRGNSIKKRVYEKKINPTKRYINQKNLSSVEKVVLQVNYKIYYTIPSSKSAANFDIIDFVDVEILYDELNIKEDDFITQQFSVTFLKSIVKEAETNPEIEVKKVLPRKTSGNPGYIFGKEILTSNLIKYPFFYIHIK